MNPLEKPVKVNIDIKPKFVPGDKITVIWSSKFAGFHEKTRNGKPITLTLAKVSECPSGNCPTALSSWCTTQRKCLSAVENKHKLCVSFIKGLTTQQELTKVFLTGIDGLDKTHGHLTIDDFKFDKNGILQKLNWRDKP